MYAIIETGGHQYWVLPGETLQVEKLDAQAGSEITFQALWAADESKEGSASQKAKVVAEVVRQDRGRKIIVFKKRPKSHYRRTAGHRQDFTEIRIKDIALN